MRIIYLTFILNVLPLNSTYSQYFNIDIGRPQPYIEYNNCEALSYQDSLWLINVNVIRDLPSSYIFYPSISIINKLGKVIKELYPTDTITRHQYSDWIKTDENEIIIIGNEYDSLNSPSFFILKLNNNLVLEEKTSFKIPRDVGEIARIKILPNNNLAICGVILNYNEINKEYEEQQGIFYLLDPDGNEIWHIEYGDTINNEKFFDFTWDADYNFYLAGQWVEPYFDGDFQSLIIKIDSTGKVIFSKLFGKKEELEAFQNIEIIGNKIVCLGGFNTADFSQNWGGLKIVYFDTSGQFINNINYFEHDIDPNQCIFQDSSIICACQKFDENYKGSGTIIKFNYAGDTIWTRDYPLFINGKKYLQRFYGINNSENGFILTGSTSKKFFQGFGANQQVWVIKVDSLGYDHITQFPTSTFEPEVNLENNIITFYPNPTSGALFYRWKDLLPLVKDRWVVSFYDLQGRIVYTHPMSINENSLMLESLSPGIYPYVIRDSKSAYVTKGKVVVQGRH